jgi:flagellar assembly protein FliH
VTKAEALTPAEITGRIRAASTSGFAGMALPGATAGIGFQTRGLVPRPADAAAEDAPPRVAAPDPAQFLAQARADAFQDGFAAGVRDGLAQGRAEGEATVAPARDAFLAVVAQFSDAGVTGQAGLAECLTQAVRRLAAQRAGQAIDHLPGPFIARIEVLADRVAQGMRQVSISLNPDDLAAITPHLDGSDLLAGVGMHADPGLARGDVDIRADGIRLRDLLMPEEGGT